MDAESLKMIEKFKDLEVVDMSNFYWVVGALIVMNIGTIGTILWTILKAAWWISKLDSRVSENTKDVNQAHAKLRRLEETLIK